MTDWHTYVDGPNGVAYQVRRDTDGNFMRKAFPNCRPVPAIEIHKTTSRVARFFKKLLGEK